MAPSPRPVPTSPFAPYDPNAVDQQHEGYPLTPVAGVKPSTPSHSDAPASGDGAGVVGQSRPAPPKPQVFARVRDDSSHPEVQDRVVQALMRNGAVRLDIVREVEDQRRQNRSSGPLWRNLAQHKGVSKDAVYEQAALTYAFRIAPIQEREPDAEFAKTVMESFTEDQRARLLDLRVAPYAYAQDQPSGLLKLVFITGDPMQQALQRMMHGLELERFELCYAPHSVVDRVLNEAYPKKNEYLEKVKKDDAPDVDFGMQFESGQRALLDEEALEAEISQSALINLTEAILVEAVRLGVSDIHVFPNWDRKTEVHFRLDGKLQHWYTEERAHPEALLAVLKDAAGGVDRFEREQAQDGFIQREVDGTTIRFRVSILPIATKAQDIKGESIVIRVLDDRKVVTDLAKLGLLEGALNQFDKAIRQPHGMVILTGPTGSGKSTTLVAALANVVTPDVNVLTVEDPVEYLIPGVRQVKLSHKLSLEGALRAILRHDPDVVMVGEMRDKDTAELAVKLANTGHLTFSTLHTNDAPSAVSRLYKMGLEPFLIAYAINLVVAQRLMRRLCTQCKTVEKNPDPVLMRELGFTEDDIRDIKVYKSNRGASCPNCKGQGYKGRRAVAEAMYFSPEIRASIVNAGGKIDEDALRKIATKQGMLSLSASAREIVRLGDTSLEEMLRVTATED
jgi:type IV pilus assembly protein PilB